jgi:putative IMPACT (imprinted ancient) family translation regulator
MTISSSATYEFTILGSRFIGLAYPLETAEEAPALLAEAQSAYPEATHYGFAWRLPTGEKASDDGEPSHTAGLPLLDVLRKQDLTGVLLVVVRYYGGRKLGAGRLTRTYREVGAKALEKAPRAEFVELAEIAIVAPYAEAAKLKKRASAQGIALKEETFSLSVRQIYEGDAKIIDDFRKSLPESARFEALGTSRSRRRKTL